MSDNTEQQVELTEEPQQQETPNNFDNLNTEEKEKIYQDFYNNNSWKTKNQERSTELKRLEEEHKKKTEALDTREKEINEKYEKTLTKIAQAKQKEYNKPLGENPVMKFKREMEEKRILSRDEFNLQKANWKLALAKGKEKYPDMNIERIMQIAKITDLKDPDIFVDFLYHAEQGNDIKRKLQKARAEGYRAGRDSFRAGELPEEEKEEKTPSEKRINKIVNEMKKRGNK